MNPNAVLQQQQMQHIRTFHPEAIELLQSRLHNLDHPNHMLRLVQMWDDGTPRTENVRTARREISEAILLLLHENGYQLVKPDPSAA